MAARSERSEPPLVVIAGPTASGKTALAVGLAMEFGGEIISADSRAIYRGLDIGTAKPTLMERGSVPHWGIDLVGPDQRFTVVDFQRYAKEAIRDIRARGHIPFLVGGTGLYIESVIYDYEFPPLLPDDGRRKALEKMTLEELHKYCEENNINLPENKRNKRYVVNNIIRKGSIPKRRRIPVANSVVVGITTKKEILWTRIAQRASLMWSSGLIEEAQRAAASYGWESEGMTGNTYRVAHAYLAGELTEAESIEQIAILDRQLAKRQMTWLRRDEHIMWRDVDEAYTYVAQVLADRSNS